MKHLHPIVVIPLSISLLIFAGCSTKPTEQIEMAQAAMDQAKEQRAAEFAISEWSEAKQAWDEAQSFMAAERYSQARTSFIRSKARFEKARDIAKAKRDALLREIEGMQKTIDIRYTGLKKGMESAKMSASLKKTMEEACSDIDQMITKLGAEIESGDYVLAKESAGKALRQVWEAEQELQSKGARRT